MRKISAQYVFPVSVPPLRYGVVVTDGEGRIREVAASGGVMRETAGTVFYNGVVVPGFIIHLTVADRYHEGAWEHTAKRLAALGCRYAVVVFHDRIFLADLLRGGREEMTAETAAALRNTMVAIRKEPEETVTVDDLFPAAGRKTFEERLYALTLAGAEAAGLPDAGRLEQGCTPGIVLLEMDFERWQVNRSSKEK